ncbi:unnamed protein product [Chrysoparadoxa australica]
MFAAQAGAAKVYAVEGSDIAESAKVLVKANNYEGVIEVIKGKLEEIELPEKVDVIVSEPIGFLLVHERMLETYVTAREKFLKPGGLMFPAVGTIVVAAITAPELHQEQMLKAGFWETQNFYGLDLSALHERAKQEHFAQPVVGYFNPKSTISALPAMHAVDFTRITCDELLTFEVPFSFSVTKTAIMHGLGCWFDLAFQGSQAYVMLSTSPECPGTHWYQSRLLFCRPLAVNATQIVRGSLKFKANERFSYDVTMHAELEGTSFSSTQQINLQDQYYHYLLTSADHMAAAATATG